MTCWTLTPISDSNNHIFCELTNFSQQPLINHQYKVGTLYKFLNSKEERHSIQKERFQMSLICICSGSKFHLFCFSFLYFKYLSFSNCLDKDFTTLLIYSSFILEKKDGNSKTFLHLVVAERVIWLYQSRQVVITADKSLFTFSNIKFQISVQC